MIKNPLPQDVYLKRARPVKGDVRGDYFRDQTKIIHSLPFRRLKHKTQVFFDPSNDHICTRMEHVLHVATIAATICRGLNKEGWDLDDDMAYAIGLGHDLGHAPFGHAGETALSKCLAPAKFNHEKNSYRVVEKLANYGAGLNLTYGVKDGILFHCGEDFKNNHIKPYAKERDLDAEQTGLPSTYEGCIVRLSDKIAYLGRDIEDAIKAKFLVKSDIPAVLRKEIGESNGEIINTLVLDLIADSAPKGSIGFSPAKFELIDELKKFNYARIYKNPEMAERERVIQKCMQEMFGYFMGLAEKYDFDYPAYAASAQAPAVLFSNYLESMEAVYKKDKRAMAPAVTDYIAGMTDSYALEVMQTIMLPTPVNFKL